MLDSLDLCLGDLDKNTWQVRSILFSSPPAELRDAVLFISQMHQDLNLHWIQSKMKMQKKILFHFEKSIKGREREMV